MKLNRREFLKIIGAAVTVAVLPSTAVALFNEPSKSEVGFSCGKQPAGNYCFSYFFKKKGTTEWIRVVKHITVEEDMDLFAKVSLNKDDEMSCPQVELDTKCYGMATNYISDQRNPIFIDKAVAILDSDIDTPYPGATVFKGK